MPTSVWPSASRLSARPHSPVHHVRGPDEVRAGSRVADCLLAGLDGHVVDDLAIQHDVVPLVAVGSKAISTYGSLGHAALHMATARGTIRRVVALVGEVRLQIIGYSNKMKDLTPAPCPFYLSTMESNVCLDWPGMDGIGTTSSESSWMKMGCIKLAGVRKFSRTIDRTPADFLFRRGRCIWLTQASPLLFVSTAALAPSVGW